MAATARSRELPSKESFATDGHSQLPGMGSLRRVDRLPLGIKEAQFAPRSIYGAGSSNGSADAIIGRYFTITPEGIYSRGDQVSFSTIRTEFNLAFAGLIGLAFGETDNNEGSKIARQELELVNKISFDNGSGTLTGLDRMFPDTGLYQDAMVNIIRTFIKFGNPAEAELSLEALLEKDPVCEHKDALTTEVALSYVSINDIQLAITLGFDMGGAADELIGRNDTFMASIINAAVKLTDNEEHLQAELAEAFDIQGVSDIRVLNFYSQMLKTAMALKSNNLTRDQLVRLTKIAYMQSLQVQQ